ncbi:MAG: sigma-70 family RNA polymerase sigma factor [Bacillota bacterium]
MDEERLIARLAAGDQTAVADLYDRLGRQVYSLAYRMLGEGAAAEDVTQEVFLKVWRQAARFDSERGRAASWILHIAYTTAVDAVRQRAKMAPGRYQETGGDEPDPAANPAEEVETALMGAQVRTALMRLPPEQRQALEMAYFGALSHSEIAGRLAVPLGTVKGRIRLGLEALRSHLLAPRRREVDRHANLPPH